MKKFLQDFKAFAMKGNVVDMAVGVIIGGAFGKIVTSLVNDVIMPLIGLAVGGVNFTELKWVIREAYVNEAGKEIAAATLNYGNFLQVTLDFLIIALSIFIIVMCQKYYGYYFYISYRFSYFWKNCRRLPRCKNRCS